MAGYIPTNKAEYFWAQLGLIENGILPAQHVNFEVHDETNIKKTLKTFDRSIHNGLYVKIDTTKLPAAPT